MGGYRSILAAATEVQSRAIAADLSVPIGHSGMAAMPRYDAVQHRPQITVVWDGLSSSTSRSRRRRLRRKRSLSRPQSSRRVVTQLSARNGPSRSHSDWLNTPSPARAASFFCRADAEGSA